MKKVISICLTMMMILSMFGSVSVVAADTPIGTPISTVSDFVNMNADGVYYLAKDIDFSGTTYTRNIYTKEFRGVLDGNGYSLLGITVKAQNGDIGIFSNGFCGTLKNITFGSEDAPVNVSSTGSSFSVAAVAGTMKDGAVFDNIVIYANVKGDGKTSGITSYIPNGKITVTNSKIYGSVTGNPAAGFFALSYDGSSNIEIHNSANYASITAKGLSAGGLYTLHADSNSSRSGSLVITGSANYGNVTATDWRSGGIIGEFHEHKGSTLTLDYCYNMGTVTMSGANGIAAGIVGGASYNAPTGKRTITNVYNGGTVVNTVNEANAYQIAYSNANTTAVTVKNAAFLNGTATKNMVEENVTACATLKKLISAVTAYPASEEGHRFVSTSANGGYPILAHEIVDHTNVKTYKCGRKVCLDCGKRLSTPEEETHIFKHKTVKPDGYLDGYQLSTCSACQEEVKTIQEASAYRPTITEGILEISTVDHLKWYQKNLEAGLLSGRESLVLTNDIDLQGENFTPIGSQAHPFGGNFDGAGHTIANLKVVSGEEGGFFGVIANAASVKMLNLASPSIEAELDAGALFGAAGKGAYVKVEWVLVTNATVVSKSGSAGALAGFTQKATQMKFNQCIADTVSVKGGVSAGGLIGYGNFSELNNCYVKVTIEAADTKKVGSLAYFSGNFTYQNSGYVQTANLIQKQGTKVNAEDFTSGAITYKVNTYANQKVYGTDGKIVTMGRPTYGVYYGEEITYTSNLLSDTGDLEVYTDGKTVAIVVKRESGPRLPDLSIKLTAGGKTVDVKFSDLTLTRRVKLNGQTCTADNASALYTVELAEVTAYQIGSYASDAVIR